MHLESSPPTIRLQRPWPLRLLDAAAGGARRQACRIRARQAARAEMRRAAQVQRELAQLSLHMQRDIGLAQGLVRQRRWQDEHDDPQREAACTGSAEPLQAAQHRKERTMKTPTTIRTAALIAAAAMTFMLLQPMAEVVYPPLADAPQLARAPA